MNMASSALQLQATEARRTRPAIWQALLLREWWAHRPLLLWLGHLYALSPLAMIAMTYVATVFGNRDLWLVTSMVVPDNAYQPVIWQFASWIWCYWAGAVLAIVLGIALGGAETTAGLEEGSLALPPTRSQRFWTRFGFAAGIVGLHALLSTVAVTIYYGLLTRPGDGPSMGGWTLAMWVAPFSLLCLAWSGAANGGPGRKPVLAFVIVGIVGLGYSFSFLPRFAADRSTLPWIDSLVLGLWSVWMLFLAYRIYCTREVHALQD